MRPLIRMMKSVTIGTQNQPLSIANVKGKLYVRYNRFSWSPKIHSD
jgi:hypothetical protein